MFGHRFMSQKREQGQPTAAPWQTHQCRQRRNHLVIAVLKAPRLLNRATGMTPSRGIMQKVDKSAAPILKTKALGAQHIARMLAIPH